eukprot:TRINITY_DN6182_c0_g1_i17.p1 TRINITY_DN6182_c0_g1~~TRINITY_DN6182_c0_g1_i17.p1  ORF type:complete len:383 (-),score=73.44 TRINITY_DN6182_c0_g1_i17:558-1706(-)
MQHAPSKRKLADRWPAPRGSLAEFVSANQDSGGGAPVGPSPVLSWLSTSHENQDIDAFDRAWRVGQVYQNPRRPGLATFRTVLDRTLEPIPDLLCKVSEGCDEVHAMHMVLATAGDGIMPRWKEVPATASPDGQSGSFVMEKFPHDLFSVITSDALYAKLSPVEVVLKIAKLVASLHAHGAVHRDLKPENLVVTADLSEIRLIDFEYAHVFSPVHPECVLPWSDPGTTKYSAPELLLDTHPGFMTQAMLKAMDVFAFGVTAHAVLRRLLLNDDKFPEPAIQDSEPARLIAAALNHNPAERPAISEIVLGIEAHLAEERARDTGGLSPIRTPTIGLESSSERMSRRATKSSASSKRRHSMDLPFVHTRPGPKKIRSSLFVAAM